MEDFQPEQPRISVLMVARNQVEAVRRTLTSLKDLAESATGEVIVVDNASTDGTEQLDLQFPAVKMLRMQRNFGWTKGTNVGTRTAKGEYLCLAQPGTEFPPGILEQLVEALEADGQALAAGPLAEDAQGVLVTRVYPLPNNEMLSEFWKKGSLGKPLPIDVSAPVVRPVYLTNTPLVMRRRSIAGMNYLDERYGQFWSDADLCFQIARAGKSIALYPALRVKAVQPYLAIPEVLDSWGAKLSADAALGAAGYLSKHQGMMKGAAFRIGAIVLALAKIPLGQPGARVQRFLNLLTGQKIDGTQGN